MSSTAVEMQGMYICSDHGGYGFKSDCRICSGEESADYCPTCHSTGVYVYEYHDIKQCQHCHGLLNAFIAAEQSDL